MNRCHVCAVVAVLFVFAVRPALAQNLCPPPSPPVAEDEPRLIEEEFNAKKFADALEYLHKDFPKVLERLRTEDLLGTESMYGYWNSLIQVKGYALLQEAALRQAQRDLAAERNRRDRATKADVAAANSRFQAAKDRFCYFLKNTRYVD